MTPSLHPLARRDLDRAARWYSDNVSPSVGRRLVEEFNRIVKIIGEHPGIGHPSSATERVLSLRRFKYAVIYQEAPLLILALRHHARRPSYGRGRR